MTKFKPTDKVKYDDEVLTIKVSRKNFANKKILYRFEGKGNLEVEEKYLKKVALTKKEKEAEKAKEAKKKLLKLGQERLEELKPHQEAFEELDSKIDLDEITDEQIMGLGTFSKKTFGEMIANLLEAESKLDLELDQRELELNEVEETENVPPPIDLDEEPEVKMTRKSKKGKK